MKPCAVVIAAVVAVALGGAAAAQPAPASLFSRAIPNIPGKTLTVVEVTQPPGSKSPAHRHAKSAFIYGYVLSGAIRMQVEGGPVQNLKAGDSFYEEPGAHHVMSENVSATVPAKFLAVFVVDTDDKVLTTPDK